MPELYVRFDKDHEAIMDGAHVDLMMVAAPDFDKVLKTCGHSPFLDLVGMTPEENALWNEVVPPDMQQEWSPALSPWTSAEEGLAMCACLRDAMAERPQDFTPWPQMGADVIEVLEPFETVLRRAKSRGARFQTFDVF